LSQPARARTSQREHMCDDAQNEVNNKLHLADDDEAPIVTLEYGPFMN